MRHAVRELCFATLLASVTCALFAQARPDYRANPKFKTAISDGKVLAEDRQYDLAIAAYQEANDIAHGKCKPCLKAIIELQIDNGDYDDAIDTAEAFKVLTTTPTEKSYAETSRGRALFLQAEPQKAGSKYDPALLNAADAALKAALALDPKNSTALFTGGQVLVYLGQTEAARAQFKTCLISIKPDDPLYLRTQRFAEDPALALQQLAPAFTIRTLDGSRFNLDQMKGRVVLVDFWATWCGPCNEELPQIKQIARDFAGQPLVILSISWDEDAQTWKDFIQKNGMTWPQYRDTGHRLGQLFQVEGIPSYFTIDSDGILTSEMLGGGFDIEGKLKKLVAKAKTAELSANAATAGNNLLN
ncbi:MAG TPA: redoxin domain-containing protein [Edaphobacter sp.]|jgi:thiol-disulfide isomerase/thioredoxin|nr:redoxin domain-containing protein [Edaphobacter sp.]